MDGKRLNDEDRLPVSGINYPRLSFLTEIGDCFKSMESKYTDRVRSLTDDTRTVLHLTLHGLVNMAKMFLIAKKFKYDLFGKFQSDPIEGEFGVYRQVSGGNYHICYENILSSLTLRRIKLFDKLKMPYSNKHFKGKCCDADLNEREIEHELSTLYYISGYIASKSTIGLDAPQTAKHLKASEFTRNVSRGLLKHPTDDLLELGMSLYMYYKEVDGNSCSTRLLKTFHQIYESSPCRFDHSNDILTRYVNCLSEGHSTKESEEIKVGKKDRKKRKERKFRHTK